MTGTDGSFTVPELPLATYSVRAFRTGGGDAVAEHVTLGTSIRLQLRPTGSITGVVRSWGSTLDELSIHVRDASVHYYRSERFFRTNGAFTIDNLPAGHFTVAAGAEGKEVQLELGLAEGEQKRGVELVLVPLVSVTGRVVDHLTKQPVAGVYVWVNRPGASTPFSLFDHSTNKSDANGRFTIKGVPLGRQILTSIGDGLNETHVVRTIRGEGVVDVGDLLAVHSRIDKARSSGDSGIDFRDFEEPFETAQLIVAKVAANSPGAKAGIKVGDVITSIDGVDTTGYAALNGWSLVLAPAGTKLSFALARGVTVDVVLAKR